MAFDYLIVMLRNDDARDRIREAGLEGFRLVGTALDALILERPHRGPLKKTRRKLRRAADKP